MNAPTSQFPIYNNKTSSVLPSSPLKRVQDENSNVSSPFIPKKKYVLIVSGKENKSSLSVTERDFQV